MTGDDEDAGKPSRSGVAAVFDSVVRDPDTQAFDEEASSPGVAEELLGSLGGEEDNLGGCRLVGVEVGKVNVATPDAADVANAFEKLVDGHAARKIGEPKSAVLLRGEVLSAGVGLRMHSVVARREPGGARSAGGVISRKGSRRSLLHHSLHGQKASSRSIAGHLSRTRSWTRSWTRSRTKSRARSTRSLLHGGSSSRRDAKDVDAERLVDDRLMTGRAEQRALKPRKIKRRARHVGSGSSHVAFHASCFSFMIVADMSILLREHGISRRPSGITLGVVRARNVGRHVDSRGEARLISHKGRRARNEALTMNKDVSLVHVGVQRAPASVSSSGGSSRSGALVETSRWLSPDLRGRVVEAKTSDEARSLAALNLLEAA